MKYKKDIRKKFILSVFLFVLMAVGLVVRFMPRSFSNFVVIENVWSGEVATSFDGGNGTKDNPYIISNGEELAYLQSLITGKNYEQYKDKYYILSNDINMGGNEFKPIGNEDNVFMGSIDGNGYTISNFKMSLLVSGDSNTYLALFPILSNATIENINLINNTITIEKANKSFIGLLSGKMNDSTIRNVSIYDNTIDVTSSDKSNVGGLSGTINKSNISYMYLDNSIKGEVNAYNLSTIDDASSITNVYIKGNKEDISNIEITNSENDKFLDVLNKNNTDSYFWANNEGDYYLARKELTSMFKKQELLAANSNIELHDSGVDNNIVYVNDLEADYNHYMGLNYTYSSDYRLPSLDNKNYYNDSNLVKMQITYDGTSTINGEDLTGTVSLNERASKYIYFKTLPVNNNGTENNYNDDYIELELIDNPFTNRPTDKGFNGWRTDYPETTIYHNTTLYVRSAKIPVSYTDGIPNDIVIDFDAIWVNATSVNSEGTLSSSTYSNLLSPNMQQITTSETHKETVEVYANDFSEMPMEGFYRYYTIYRGTGYPPGALNSSGASISGECNSNRGCNYYLEQSGYTGSEGVTYYRFVNRNFVRTTINFPYLLESREVDVTNYLFDDNDNMSTLFEKVTIPRNSSLAGYYDANGNALTGTCGASNGCEYYNLIQYYDESGNENTFKKDKNYYYLTTRDTNFIVINNSINLYSIVSLSNSKPATLTSVYNGTAHNVTFRHAGIKFQYDGAIENVNLIADGAYNSTTVPSTYNTNNLIYANSNNVKLGRGLTVSSTGQKTADSFISSDDGSSFQTYRVIIESGSYNILSLTGMDESAGSWWGGGDNHNTSKNLQAFGIYGNDYDRVTNNNSNLDIYFCASGSWGDTINQNSNRYTFTAFNLIVKSGTFGSRRPTSGQDSDNYYSYGIYVGGRQGGTTYAAKTITVEGGDIFNLIGGPLTSSAQASYNDVMMYVKGGSIDAITGGAGRSETYGNRIIQVTGGEIKYAIFGGSNGITGSNGEGKLDGKTYIYVGGNAIIGTRTDTLYGANAGSVFGIGNGRDYFSQSSSYKSIGATKGANIVIDGNATINGSVYGGGNFGGIATAYNVSTDTNIKIVGGTIKDSVYGGANKNDSGQSSYTANIYIDMEGGVVENSIYGGANQVGIVYGNVDIKINGGKVLGNVYGGGRGGYLNSSAINQGTYIRNNINIQIGDTNIASTPEIEGSVYGGSAYGMVNGTSNSTTATSSDGVNVTVNKGKITDSVYGGAEGSSNYTPKVLGPIVVNINDGTIGSVYGANNAAGIPTSTIDVYLKGGVIGNVYGGGQNTGMNTSTIYQIGSTVNDSIFGGSNLNGTAAKSNVIVTGGTATNIYGGNNLGGKTEDANIEMNGGIVKNTIYGGGNIAETDITHVNLNGGKTKNVFGGGAEASVLESTNVVNKGIDYYADETSEEGEKIAGVRIFGGSDSGGDIPISNVTNESDIKVFEIYGGNNLDGLTSTSNIKLLKGNVTNIFGGGNQIGVNTSNINLVNGEAESVYGGANQSGTVNKSNIINKAYEYEYNEKVEQTNNNIYATHELSNSSNNRKTLSLTLNNRSNRSITTWSVEVETSASTLISNSRNITINKNGNTYSFNQSSSGQTTQINYYGSYNINLVLEPTNTNEKFEIIKVRFTGSDRWNQRFTYSYELEKKLIEYDHDLTVRNVYGGNNLGGTTTDTNLVLEYGKYNNIFGGGNQAVTIGNTYVKGTNINVDQSVFGGGNDAAVLGNTDVYIGGVTTVGASVFGGGNHGAVGSENSDNSIANVDIVGATVGKNVYGGCNTSTVYGETKVKIGASAVGLTSLPDIGDVSIGGTIFGGGESNEAGSDKYDFSAISVTKGIDILIDGTGYDDFIFGISGSIFGSGNASSSAGYSNITIRKLGNKNKPNTAISIQRTDTLIIDDSTIELTGTTDRTDEYHPENLFSLNRIKCMKLKNGTYLLLNENANMLERFESLVDINGTETKAEVKIDKENNTIEKNVDNRLYMKVNRALNVSLDQQALSYGIVYGMTFLGMYQKYSNGAFVYGMYDSKYNSGDEANEGLVLNGNTSVVGLHALNHDITVDGYYTNFIDEAFTELTTDYINPTPPTGQFYIWSIGTQAINYSISLTASRYSSLGTRNLIMRNDKLSNGNTTFVITAVNTDGLSEGVVLKDSNSVPKLATTQEEANSVMGISLKTETSEWTNHGTTKFIKEDGNSYFTGESQYMTDSQVVEPNLMFYLYHAKNITSNLELGTIVISMQAIVPRNDLEYDTYRINIEVSIRTKEYNEDAVYDASITYSKKYEMPSLTPVNITNRSQFTAYYSVLGDAKELGDFYGKDNEFYHTLVSDIALPVGTKITMIDYGYDDVNPRYYYLIIDEERYQSALNMLENSPEIDYRLSEFISMDSTSSDNTYNDKESNLKYFHDNIDIAMEEFIFIFDFKDTTTNDVSLGNKILFELRDAEDRTEVTVLGILQENMVYNLYQDSNSVLSADTTIEDNYVYYDTAKPINNVIRINYELTGTGGQSVIDTNYESSNLGINVTLFDTSGNQISSSQLSSATLLVNNKPIYVDSNGVFKAKLADKVSNINKAISFITGNTLPVGAYKMKIDIFASNDGLHNSDENAISKELDIIVVGSGNLIVATIDDKDKVIDGETGLTVNDINQINIQLKYQSVLSNPNIRLSVYKRDVSNSVTSEYKIYDGRNLFINNLTTPDNGLKAQNSFEFLINRTPSELMNYKYTLKGNLTSGTYKMVFRLYDNNQLIDEDYEYIIIKKKVS